MAPQTPRSLPEFLATNLEGRSPEELRTITDYLGEDDLTLDVPDFVVEASALQDDETLAAVVGYAGRLADFYESGGDPAETDAAGSPEDGTAGGSDAGNDDSGRDDSDRDGPGNVAGPFFG